MTMIFAEIQNEKICSKSSQFFNFLKKENKMEVMSFNQN
jgi:hypothetical protein